MHYWLIFSLMEDGARLSGVPEKGPKDYQYDKGESLASVFPPQEDAIMCFDSNYPYRLKLYDIVPALDSVIIGNNKVKSVIEVLCKDRVEFLPITIWNDRRETASKDYYIFNPLGSYECIDMQASEYDLDPMDETQIYDVDLLKINRKTDLADVHFFRDTHKLDQFFISDTLKAALEAAGIQGYKTIAAEGWDGVEL